MARSRVVSWSWPRGLAERCERLVPAEARSAFVWRAICRQIATSEHLEGIAWTGLLVEAFARGWITGAIHGASMDPRDVFMGCDLAEVIDDLTIGDELRVGKDKAGEGLPPIVLRGREWVRRGQAVEEGESIPGSKTVSVRVPVEKVEFFHTSVPRGRSAFVAGAVECELHIAAVGDARLERTEDTMRAFEVGLGQGVWHGNDLLRDASLDADHVETIVAREIAGYLLEPGIVARR